ncbi:MAG: hypothetical protein ABJ308_13895 [Halieaceae bacterium]
MSSFSSLLEKVPHSPGFLLALAAIAFIVFRSYQITGQGEREIEKWESAVDKRVASVNESIASLEIPDEGLLNCITTAAMDRANIHPMNTGGIDDVRELQLLYCRGNEVSTLIGIKALSKLRYIDISKNDVASLDPLAEHPNLKTLHVAQNPLINIRVVRTLPALKEIYLPNLPDQSCADIERLLKGVKSNFKAIDCAGKEDGKSKNLAVKADTNDWSNPREEKGLTDRQHQELLEYERNMRYQER